MTDFKILQFESLLSDDKNLFISTKRLELEPCIESHAEQMLPLLLESSLYTFVPQDPPTLAELRSRYAFWSKRRSPDGTEVWLNWIARCRVDGECVGHFQAGLDAKNGFKVAYTIVKGRQRQGFATEGLRAVIQFLSSQMQAPAIKAWVDTRNAASVGLLQKLGFQKIDFLKNADEFKGTKSDEFVFELGMVEV